MNRSIGCPCGQCESCEFPSHREKLVSIPYVSVQCGFLMKGQIGGFHVTSSPPCWWTVNKRSLISSLCLSTSICSFHHCYLCLPRLHENHLNHFGVSYTSLRASGFHLLCCLLLQWIKGFSLIPRMLNIYTMINLPPLVYVLQVGRA